MKNKRCLFTSLFKYRERESMSPKENFFTEALAYILSKDRELLQKFLLLCKTSMNGIIEVRTQQAYNGKFIDLEICTKEKSLFVEIKVGSSVNEYETTNTEGELELENQLLNYLKIQEERAGNNVVILLTKYPEEVRSEVINHTAYKSPILWQDLYLLFKKHKTNNPINDFLIKEFLSFMKSEDMHPFTAFQKDDEIDLESYKSNILKFLDTCLENGPWKLKSVSQAGDGRYIGRWFDFKEQRYQVAVWLEQKKVKMYKGAKTKAEYEMEMSNDYLSLSAKEQIAQVKKFITNSLVNI